MDFEQKALILLIKEYELVKQTLSCLEFKIDLLEEMIYEGITDKEEELIESKNSWLSANNSKKEKLTDLYNNMSKVFDKYRSYDTDSFVEGLFIYQNTNSVDADKLWNFIRFKKNENCFITNEMKKLYLIKEIFNYLKNSEDEETINNLLKEYNDINENEDEEIGECKDDLDYQQLNEYMIPEMERKLFSTDLLPFHLWFIYMRP